MTVKSFRNSTIRSTFIAALSLIIGSSAFAQSCPADQEGLMRYSASIKNFEFCDGTEWRRMGGYDFASQCRRITSWGTHNWATLSCSADEYLVDILSGDAGDGADVRAISGGYGGSARFGADQVFTIVPTRASILCCK